MHYLYIDRRSRLRKQIKATCINGFSGVDSRDEKRAECTSEPNTPTQALCAETFLGLIYVSREAFLSLSALADVNLKRRSQKLLHVKHPFGAKPFDLRQNFAPRETLGRLSAKSYEGKWFTELQLIDQHNSK